jgi:DNA-directed RNA polymerase subunit RPC12/RpoP
MTVVLGVLGVLWLMGQAASLLPEEEREGGLGVGCIICSGATLLYLLPYGIVKGGAATVSALARLQRWLGGPAGELPRIYWRTCRSCGLEWTWKAGDPPRRVRIRRTPAAREKGKAGKGRRRPLDKEMRRRLQQIKGHSYQPFMDTLVSHWNGTHTPSPGFELETPGEAVAFFRRYQRALGEDPDPRPGHHVTGFFRNTPLSRDDILLFVRAYWYLECGKRSDAAQRFRDLVRSHPGLADAWLWLSATADGPGERMACLEKAIRLEPAHPLALDALAVARGELSAAGEPGKRAEPEAVIVRCPRCGGGLRYEPGAEAVECRYCEHRISLHESKAPDREAPLVTTLRLQRRHQGRAWTAARRALRCEGCGAELAMARRLAAACAYCGSRNVLASGDPRTLQQPDGILPFRVDEREATAALCAGVKGRTGRRRIEAGTPRGLYVPFWLFDGAVEVRWLEGAGGRTPSSEHEHQVRFDDLLFPAVDAPPPSVLDRVGPFRLWKLAPYEPHVLADWPAQLYNLDVELVVEDAYDTMLALAHRRSGPPVSVEVVKGDSGKRSGVGGTMRTLQVSQVTYRLVLVPLWVAPFRHKGERCLGLVNGQTGSVTVHADLSGGR